VPLIDDDTCAADFGPTSAFQTPITGLTLFCAGVDDADPTVDPTHNEDSCNGDSGGPLTIDPNQDSDHSDVQLAGLVDSGFGCAWTNLPGIYTDVSQPSTFITTTDPENTVAPAVMGTPQVGQQLSCDPGQWTGTPGFLYRFYRETSGNPVPVSTQSDGPNFTVPANLAGVGLFCETQATDPANHILRTADSADVTILSPPVQPPPPPPPPPPAAADSRAPGLHITSKTCTKTSCTLKLRVTDPPPSSGVGGVNATLRWTSKHKQRHRKLTAKAGKNGTYTIVAKGLTPQTHYSFALLPFDQAGNKPAFSTITTVRTKPRHRSGLLD
jgi:hypothetical protein